MRSLTQPHAEPGLTCVSEAGGERGDAHRDQRTIDVIVDCVDPASSDLLALWLSQAGYAVANGPSDSAAAKRANIGGPMIAITDRFDPSRGRGAAISALRAQYEGSVIVVVGRGGQTQTEVLALARASGADATMPLPLIRHEVVTLIARLGLLPAPR